MASIGCPFCTKTGVTMVITGLAFVLFSVTLTIPWLAIIGLAFLIAAYIVPGLVNGRSCHSEGCTNPSHNHGEDDTQ
ncbi:MAG: hypothetical protein ACXACH_00825 [Candidatus Hermodarchaeia archaeon]|jgi:hypothetical protein